VRKRECEEPGCDRSAAWICTRPERTGLREFLCAEHWRAWQASQAAVITDYSPIRGDEREVAAEEDLPPAGEATMDIAFEARDSYLYVRLAGHWNPRTMQETILQVRDEALRQELPLILIDGRNVDPPLSDYYRFVAGQDAARFLPPPYRTAVIGVPETVTGFAETVANLGGANLKVFVADAPAMEWLLQASGAAGG
jgi:hypothetical protein